MRKKIKGKWLIEVPEGAEVLVKDKSKVDVGDELIKVKGEEIRSYSVADAVEKLGEERVKKIVDKWRGKEVKEGQELGGDGKLFGKKWYSPGNGAVEGIDEFYNLHLRASVGEEKVIRSPLKAVVDRSDKKDLVLAFDAWEFKGQGLIEGKVWGECDFEIVRGINDLSSRRKGEVVLVEGVDELVGLKAEVVGVRGLVILENETTEQTGDNLPILTVAEEVWKDLVKLTKKRSRVLLNSKTGRLLVVIE